MLTFHLLGQPRLLFDSAPFQLNAPPKTLPLLAYLLLHRDRIVERYQVAFALWPDDPEPAARANLRRHLHQLQRVLPPAPPDRPWLLGDARTVGWNPQADYWLDVAEFEWSSARPDRLEEAIACYTGDLLETISDDWIFFERERLRELYFASLSQLVFQRRAGRNYPAAIGFAQQLLRGDPFREDALRQLIALRYEAGDRAGAIQEFEAFERRLRREMGVAPMPETQALHEIILRNARLPAAGAPQVSGGMTNTDRPCATPSLPFTGREVEMTQLNARWSRTAHGFGGLALIGGEAGVGKSRLARELALLVESQGGRVLYGSTSPGEPRPYQAVIEALQSALPLLTALEGDPPRLAALAHLIPELSSRFTLPTLLPLDPDRDRLRLFDAVATCLTKLAEPRPLLLVLEDLHWAGETSIALAEFLTRRAAACYLLILGTYRDEETPRIHPLRSMRRRLQSENLVEHLPLNRLSPQAVEALISQVAGERPEDASRLYSESEGNPLFIEMLWRHWQEAGESQSPLPGGIRTIITQRLERLPAEARAYAEAAAILGAAFDADATREVGRWDEAQAHAALRELLDCRLVRDAEGRSRYDYIFAHHLIQATLYHGISPAKRRRRHHRAAEVLENIYPMQRDERAGELAVHYDKGGAPARAIPYYLVAARRRLEIFADAEALAFLDRALHLADDAPDGVNPRTVFDLLLLRESIYHRRGARPSQVSDLKWLDRLAISLGDAHASNEVLYRWILYNRVLGERSIEAARIAELTGRAERMGDFHWQAVALQEDAAYQVLIGQTKDAQASLERALALNEQISDFSGMVKCYCMLAETAVRLGVFDQAQAFIQQAQQRAAAQASPQLVAMALRAAALAAFNQEHFSLSENLARQALDLFHNMGDLEGDAFAHSHLAMIFTRLDRDQTAHDHFKMAGELYQQSGDRRGQAKVLTNSAIVYGHNGQYAEACELFEKAEILFAALGDRRGLATIRVSRGAFAADVWDLANASSDIERGLEIARSIENRVIEANALCILGDIYSKSGRLEEARASILDGIALQRSLGRTAWVVNALANLCLIYLLDGRLAEARRTADETLTLAEGHMDDLEFPHHVFWFASRVYRADGEESRAMQLLARSYASLQEAVEAKTDARARSWLLNIPENRQIVAAYERGEWP